MQVKKLLLFFAILLNLILLITLLTHGGYTYLTLPEYKIVTLPFNTARYVKVDNLSAYLVAREKGSNFPIVTCNNFSQLKKMAGNATIAYSTLGNTITFVAINHKKVYVYTYTLKDYMYNILDIGGNKALLKLQPRYDYLGDSVAFCIVTYLICIGLCVLSIWKEEWVQRRSAYIFRWVWSYLLILLILYLFFPNI